MRPAVWRRQSRKSRSNPVAQDMSFATSPFGGMSFTACTVAKGSVWRAILTGTYPDREIRTFDKQESEARAYAADATASTPLLSALAQAGLSDCAGQPARELSGGQRRRVALLRALLAPWDLLLLDEPFKGLDTETRKQIMDYVLLHFHKKPGRTVLLVTHDESEAAYMAENVFTLPVPL